MKNWAVISLSEVLQERRETPLPEDLLSRKVRIVSKIGFNEGQIAFRDGNETKTGMILIRPGDLVLSGINALKGAIAIYPETESLPIAATIHYSAYQVNNQRAEISYMWWFLRSRRFREIALDYLPGGIKTELKASRFLPILIPLPPLDEQCRLVSQIEEIALRIRACQLLRKEAISDSNLVIRGIIAQFLAEGKYKYVPLRNVLAEPLQNGLSIPASGIGKDGILFARVGIVNSGRMNPNETKRVNLFLSKDSNFWMKSDDVFVSRGNSLELVGRAALYEGQPENCAFPDLLIRIRTDRTQMDPRFLVYYFQTVEARKYIELEASGTSPSMKKVSQPKLEKMLIPIPTIDEQAQIVAYLDIIRNGVDALRSMQAIMQNELDALLPSILEKAFKGKL